MSQNSSPGNTQKEMQHSVKFVLADSTSYARVVSAFPQGSAPLVVMEDSFLDTEDKLLSRNSIILRVRRYVAARCHSGSHHQANGDLRPRAEVRAMQHSTVTDGCGQRWDTSADLDPTVAEKIFLLPGNEPAVFGELLDRLLSSCGEFLRDIVSSATQNPAPPVCKFVRLGGYKTLRDTRPWTDCQSQSGLKLRIDHTTYAFGERFEVEVPDISVPVQDVVDELGAKMEKLGAAFVLGHETKWQVCQAALASESVKKNMAVAAKIELATLQDYETVRRSLGGQPAESEFDEPFGELQENYFFDDMNFTLRRRNIVFRLRVVPHTGKAFVTIKENEPVNGGSAVSWMQQEEVPRELVESTLQDPTNFFLHPSSAAEKLQQILQQNGDYMSLSQVQQQHQNAPGSSSSGQNLALTPVKSSQGNIHMMPSNFVRSPPKPGTSARASDYPQLQFVGAYRNRRETFVWPSCQSQPGLSIYLDRTQYEFGERFELEVPGITVPVHDVVSELSEVLVSLGARFRPAGQDKMQTMLEGTSHQNAKPVRPPMMMMTGSNNNNEDEEEERNLF